MTDGPSPRGRGNPGRLDRSPDLAGAVHPRVGGETLSMAHRCWRRTAGSIPAWAGKPSSGKQARGRRPQVGSIPAWAGKPGKAVAAGCGGSTSRVHPRVGGETCVPLRLPGLDLARGPSPRGRGNRRSDRVVRARLAEVHPRVGGETRASVSQATIRGTHGPSPRGRGNRTESRRADQIIRNWSIPAWAGKPSV